ncbi:hypothetical protein KIN20_000684 [Parelaphostrongylus tenuis]|uniref:Uncharacterized protein n=1 Tax=Parelaphostrongylus tenuis TaxID=148309 RepID=A0AAD5ML03_PARTN|nr:hypothetical protein KIN20_000684 [Parelaphostrongylus tenuis]
MPRQHLLMILFILSALHATVPFRFHRHLPQIIRRISQEIHDEDNSVVPVTQWRERRGQPIIDYVDEFSADPFEIPTVKGRRQ